MALPHHSSRPQWIVLNGIVLPVILGVLIPFLIPLRVEATTVNLNADQDNTMYAENSLNSNGAGDYIFAGATDDGFARRALVRFDVSAIPPGSTINSVSLRLFCSRAKQNTGYQVAMHRLLADWGEGTSHAGGEEGQGAPATLNDATWTYRFYPTSLWSSPGGDYFAIASASAGVGANGSFYTWTSSGLLTDVQSWVDGIVPNNGWLLIGAEATIRSAKRFNSRSNTDATRRPLLTIDYTSSGGATGACCLPAGGCEEVTSAECAALGGTYHGDGTSCEPDPCGAGSTVNLSALKDNTLYESATGSLSNGAGERFFAGKTNQGSIRRGLIAFDLSGIPAGATITNAALTLHLSQGGGGTPTVSLHRATANWGEGASDAGGDESSGAPATNGDATWLHKFYSSQFWTAAGGDWVATPSASKPVGSEPFHTWSSAALTADVQNWFNAPATNFGWVIVGQESSNNTAKRFDTRQVLDSTFRPVLQVTYTTTTEPTGACCLHDGSCDTLTQTACETAGGTYQGDGTTCVPDLCSVQLTPFVDALPIPPLAVPTSGAPGGIATYDIEIQEVSQKLHRDLPLTRVWGYDGMYPGPSILAFKDRPITVNWINDLRDSLGNLRTTHYLPVDTCLHGPDMEGPTARIVTHLHGGHVPTNADGYPTATILPGEQTTYVYPNHQIAGTLWYHDHALGITRLNVMMGLAGFYLLQDSLEVALDLPEGEYDIGLAIQDRAFHSDGSLKYPAMWEEHFFGDKILVNGKVWPYLNVKRGKYRFRVLGGSNSRSYTLSLSNNAPFHVIGNEGGLLPAPIVRNALTITPGERYDVVIDFASYAPGTEIILMNSAPAPFPGAPGVGVIPEVMKFIVTSATGHTNPLPATLLPLEQLEESDAVEHRQLTLQKITGPLGCGHSSIWTINGLRFHDDITEFPELGTTEVWNFVNPTGVSHPMHMHLVMFQILDRTPITMVGDSVVATGPPVQPDAAEAGWKDTAVVHPDQMMRVITRFDDYTGQYPYHCHILEHEENDMMRQFEVVNSAIGVEASAQSYSFGLERNRPNPFDYRTSINFQLPKNTHVSLKVYDIRGRLVCTLLDGVQPAGRHQLDWDGKDSSGSQTSPGIYFVRLASESFEAARKINRVR